MSAVAVTEGSILVGDSVGALDIAVVAVRSTDGDVVAIPPRSRTLEAGETIYAIGRPDRLRKLENAAGSGTGPSTATEG